VIKGVEAPGNWSHVKATAPQLVEVCAGGSLRLDPEVTLRFLNPTCDGHITPRTTDLHNDGAMVTLIEHGDIRAVVPADAEACVLVHLPLPKLDFLRISHHGSSDPCLPDLLTQVQPRIAAISVGEGNDYGHPRRDVLDALDAGHVRAMRTDQDGTVTLDSDGHQLVLQ
jgi:competence protein ComEC